MALLGYSRSWCAPDGSPDRVRARIAETHGESPGRPAGWASPGGLQACCTPERATATTCLRRLATRAPGVVCPHHGSYRSSQADLILVRVRDTRDPNAAGTFAQLRHACGNR